MVWQGGLACQDLGRFRTANLFVAFDNMFARPSFPVFRARWHTSGDSEKRPATRAALFSF
jgi:hypothetical protein